MIKKHIGKIKIVIYIFFALIVFFSFLGIKGFGKRINESLFLLNHSSEILDIKDIPEKLKDERQLLQISKNIKNKSFTIALKYISGDVAEDYFNRGTVKLIYAYNLSKNNNLTGLQQSRLLISQANNDLETAEKIQLNNSLKTYIIKNKKTAEGLLTIIETKACYQEGGILLSEIRSTLEETNKIIVEQSKQLEKLRNLKPGAEDICISNLINIIDNNRTQISNVKSDMTKKEQEYKSIIGQKLNSPEKCRGTSFENSLNKTLEAKESMKKYLQQQLEISMILGNPTPEGLAQLCNGSKNDSQLNENLSNSVSQMMKDLQQQSEKEKNKDANEKKEEKKDQNKKDGENNNGEEEKEGQKEGETKSQNGKEKNKQGNGEKEYKDVLNQQEREILNQTEKSSNSLIKQIQQIKGQGNYNGYEYIKNLFNSFMGNEGDLRNLHKNQESTTEESIDKTQRY